MGYGAQPHDDPLPLTHRLCEHLLFGKLIASGVCGTDRFCSSIIRVCPPQEVLRTAYGGGTSGKHKLCEYVLSGKIVSSSACRVSTI